tara:strand:+ start:2176 stop:2355 length:180 start_codon:yes stop_codon:yes gene_type:complete
MSGIPGISDYPELEKRFRVKLREARRKRGCSRCAVADVISRFRLIVDQRRKRDKKTRRS